MLGINEKANQCLQSLLRLPYGFIAKAFLLVGIVQSIIACTGLEVMSMEVKSGGTVMVAVSGAVDDETPETSQLTAKLITYEDEVVVEHDVTVRYVMRVFPDPLSQHGLSNEGGTQSYQYKSQIFAIVDILPPGSSTPPIDIETGAATLEINNALTSQITSHEIEILEGTTSKNPLTTIDQNGTTTGGWSYALPNPNVLIKTSSGTFDPASGTIAGATFTLNYDTADFQATSEFLAVVKTTNDPNLQLSWSYNDLGDSTSQLIITLSNPHGFYSPSESNVVHKDLKSVFRHLSSVAIAWLPPSYAGSNGNPFTGLQATYFDTNGDVVNGLTTLSERRH